MHIWKGFRRNNWAFEAFFSPQLQKSLLHWVQFGITLVENKQSNVELHTCKQQRMKIRVIFHRKCNTLGFVENDGGGTSGGGKKCVLGKLWSCYCDTRNRLLVSAETLPKAKIRANLKIPSQVKHPTYFTPPQKRGGSRSWGIVTALCSE